MNLNEQVNQSCLQSLGIEAPQQPGDSANSGSYSEYGSGGTSQSAGKMHFHHMTKTGVSECLLLHTYVIIVDFAFPMKT